MSNFVKLQKKKTLFEIINRFHGLKSSGSYSWMAECPAHPDKTPSLSITYKPTTNRLLINCFAGCDSKTILKKVGLSFSDLQCIKLCENDQSTDVVKQCNTPSQSLVNKKNKLFQPKKFSRKPLSSDFTLSKFSQMKKLPVRFLKKCGLKTVKKWGKKVVRIGYSDREGNEKAIRYRGLKSHRWNKGNKILLFGLDRINEAVEKGFIFLVEGESDCLTLWHHGFPAVGVPGANNWNERRDAKHFKGIKRIYFPKEPDKAGDQLKEKLKESSLADRIFYIDMGAYKDPSELHIDDPANFKTRLLTRMDGSIPLVEWDDLKLVKKTRATSWEQCKDIAKSSNILNLLSHDLNRLDVVGETSLSKLLYLCIVTRLYKNPVSINVRGPSGSGKSHVTAKVVNNFFPKDACFITTSISDKYLFYAGPFKHRFIWINEMAGINSSFLDYTIRSLQTEGKITHGTLTQGKKSNQWVPETKELEGPTGLILTTTKNWINPENENRGICVYTSENRKQTERIIDRQAEIALGNHCYLSEEQFREQISPNWKAFHNWIASGPIDVIIPFADLISDHILPIAVRIRRDFPKILTLIKAHALIHQNCREKSPSGQIIATIEDYAEVYKLVAKLLDFSIKDTKYDRVKSVVDAVERATWDKKHTTLNDIMENLKISKATASRHTKEAIRKGYLVNHENRRGRASKIGLGNPLPAEKRIFPPPDLIKMYIGRKRMPLSEYLGMYKSDEELSDRPFPPKYRHYRYFCNWLKCVPASEEKYLAEADKWID